MRAYVDILAALCALAVRDWLCGNGQIKGSAGRRRLQQLPCECGYDGGHDGLHRTAPVPRSPLNLRAPTFVAVSLFIVSLLR